MSTLLSRLRLRRARAGAAPADGLRFLGDALRELMLFHLFQAGERLPREADERLGREVKRRYEALGPVR
jgi:hypothetical protein